MRRREVGETALAWALALLVHAGLLAAFLRAETRSPSPLPRPTVALVFQPQAAAPPRPVAPTPPATPASPPPKPPLFIAQARREPEPAKKAAKPAVPQRVPQAVSRQEAEPHPAAASAAAAQPGFAPASALGSVNQPPEYPAEAQLHGEEGAVLLSIHVLPNGRTDFVSVTQSSGYRLLDQAAQAAVMKWRFHPATFNGQPVVQVISYRINFDLRQNGADQ